MFVFKSTHEQECKALKAKLKAALDTAALAEKVAREHQRSAAFWHARYTSANATANAWKSVAERKPTQQFSKDELRSLIQLCHPDKHAGKQTAVAITAKLIDLRNQAG